MPRWSLSCFLDADSDVPRAVIDRLEYLVFAWYGCRSPVVSLRGTVIALTWLQCMVRLLLSRGIIAWYGYRPHVVSLRGAVIALSRSLCMVRLLPSRGIIAWCGYGPHAVSFHGTVSALTWCHCIGAAIALHGTVLSLSRCPEADKDRENGGAKRVGVVSAHGHVHPRQDSHDARRNQPGEPNGEQYNSGEKQCV